MEIKMITTTPNWFFLFVVLSVSVGVFAGMIISYKTLRERFKRRIMERDSKISELITLKAICEDVLVEWFECDDSHVVDDIVENIRIKSREESFARGATFSDHMERGD